MDHQYPAPRNFAQKAYANNQQYQTLYQYSINNPDNFWAEQATKFIHWLKPWQTAKSGGFEQLDIRWFIGEKLNTCYNCADRHLATRANQTAIIWGGDNPKETLFILRGARQVGKTICLNYLASKNMPPVFI